MPVDLITHSWTGVTKPFLAIDRNPRPVGMSRTDKTRIEAHFTFQTSQLRLNLDPCALNRPVIVQARALEWAGTQFSKKNHPG